jgi:hypothetical protein
MFHQTPMRAIGASINIVLNGEKINRTQASRCIKRALLNMSGQMAHIGRGGGLSGHSAVFLYRYLSTSTTALPFYANFFECAPFGCWRVGCLANRGARTSSVLRKPNDETKLAFNAINSGRRWLQSYHDNQRGKFYEPSNQS